MDIKKDIKDAEAKIKKKMNKRTIVGLVFLGIFFVVTVLSFVFYNELYGETGWVKQFESDNALLVALVSSVPRIFGTVEVLFITLLFLYVFCFVAEKICRGTPRRITVGKLVSSIGKVIICFIGLIAILAVWGVDVGALLAGAGVVTLIVGLGMQSLIADVVAGVFLVGDGTLEVGDVVTIDGWRGTVQEIGIRNTRLINYSGDIRVANNSTIKVFINQSREYSYPMITVGVAYEEDLREVEKIIAENRDRIRENTPNMISGPDYCGVDALADSGVNVLLGATCKEVDFYQVQRDLRREVKCLFDEKGIRIPFPQVDVHTPDAKPQKIFVPEEEK